MAEPPGANRGTEPRGILGLLLWKEFIVRQVVQLKEHRTGGGQPSLWGEGYLPTYVKDLELIEVKGLEKLKAVNKCKEFAIDPMSSTDPL